MKVFSDDRRCLQSTLGRSQLQTQRHVDHYASVIQAAVRRFLRRRRLARRHRCVALMHLCWLSKFVLHSPSVQFVKKAVGGGSSVEDSEVSFAI